MEYFRKAIDFIIIIKDNYVSSFKRILGFAFVKAMLAAILTVNLLDWTLAYYINRGNSAEKTVLHYNVDFGINLIGSDRKIYLIPLLGIIFFAANFAVITIFVRHRIFLFITYFLLAAPLLAHIYMSAALVSLYLINFT